MRISMQQQNKKGAQVYRFDIVTLISNGYTTWEQNHSLPTIFKSSHIARTIIGEIIQINPPN
jgi:hypothetical protein